MTIALDHSSETPLHLQAEKMLRRLVAEDEYKNGKFLPNEVDLSRQLGISRNTLRQAINKLVYEGVLVRRRGVGTKVVHQSILGGVKNWLSFSQEMKQLGIEVRNYELHVSYSVPRLGEIRTFFNLPDSDNRSRCMVLERLRGNTEYPFVFFESYFNPNIPFSGEENFARPLYEILEKQYGIVVKVSKEEVSARIAESFIAGKLGIDAKDPILIRKRFVYDTEGRPVEYNVGYYRADSFTYSIEAVR